MEKIVTVAGTEMAAGAAIAAVAEVGTSASMPDEQENADPGT